MPTKFAAITRFMENHLEKEVDRAELEKLFNSVKETQVREGAKITTFNALMQKYNIPYKIIKSRLRPDAKQRNSFKTVWKVKSQAD